MNCKKDLKIEMIFNDGKECYKNGEIRGMPEIKRDAPLLVRLLAIAFIGFDTVFDKAGGLYCRILCRLIDKAFKDYSSAKECVDKEIKSGDKLAWRILIIDHLEDCIFSMSRVIRIVDMLEKGVRNKSFACCLNCKQEVKVADNQFQKSDFLKFSKLRTFVKLRSKEIRSIRNRIEHIDEDVYFNIIEGPVFLDVDNDYEGVLLNRKYCSFIHLANIIESYHEFMLEIIKNLPMKCDNGTFYDENNEEWKRPA